jgi:signal peptidase
MEATATSVQTGGGAPALRRVLGILGTVATVALAAGWFVALRPTFLGGATSYVLVSGASMEPEMRTGDLSLVRRQDTYRRGDVIAFEVPRGEPGAGALVIHRIVGGSASAGFVVRGDNRERPDLWRPRPSDIRGVQVAHLPGVGRAFALLRSPLGMATAAGLLTFFWIGGDGRRRRRA